ncbi:MAG: HAMP domain-containing histidine kinase [Lentisphaeria bacterium]|nr:HAMP domain-containing histidine kinase [Candidatus Neomarinimicrobiota bacterium]MCF7842189.1 HAMP domain-containing histidine kinase [Lentisphaeria bacterium]
MTGSKPVARSVHFKKNQDIQVKPGKIALLTGAAYVILAGLYIILSTQWVAIRADSVDVFKMSELQKGLLYVWVTGIMLSAFIWIIFTRIAEQQKKIVEQRNALLISERQAIAGMLSSSVAHDINNILSTLSMALHLFEDKLELDTEGEEHLGHIRKGHEQLKNLTERLMTIGRSNIKSDVRSYLFGDVLQEALEFSKSHDDVRFCGIDATCPEELEMSGYPDLVQQMFFNLLLNSAQAARNSCELKIRVEEVASDFVAIEIHDNGPGIPKDQRELVFQPFYSTKETGNGLGMLSIQACVEAHGGEIDIDTSEDLGGAKFTVTLPRNVASMDA